MKAWIEPLHSTCGVGLIYNYDPNWDGVNPVNSIRNDPEAGCGWYVAGFVNTPKCREMYEKLSKEFPIVYQSPVRINANSGSPFFFCIFDAGPVEEN